MKHHFLRGARVYLSGPMDFVASRADEKKLGWRNRVGDFLRSFGAIVFDPWFKPTVRGLHEYGLEDLKTVVRVRRGASSRASRATRRARRARKNSGKRSAKFQWVGFLVPFVASAGSLISGYVSDTLFNGRRTPVAAGLYFIEAVVILAAAQFHSVNAALFFLVLISLTANATHSILGTAAAMDIGGARHAGFASGLIDSFQYLDAGLSTVDERTKFDGILRNHSKYATWKKTYPAAGLPGVPLEKFIVMLASLYPDDIRNHDNPETFPEWHYVDYPLLPPDFPMKPAPTPGDDVLTGIAKSAKAVYKLTGSFDTRTRAKMLSFLLHLVGDVHQPLHCETLFDQNFTEPDGDRGGNNAWVKPPGGHAIKLHAFWDQLFGSGGQLFHPIPLTMILAAEHRAKELAPLFPRPALPELAEHTTPVSWSLESRALAISDCWRRHELAYGLTEATAAVLPADYEEKAHAIANRQVALAGHRLADQLREVLK